MARKKEFSSVEEALDHLKQLCSKKKNFEAYTLEFESEYDHLEVGFEDDNYDKVMVENTVDNYSTDEDAIEEFKEYLDGTTLYRDVPVKEFLSTVLVIKECNFRYNFS